MRELTYLRCLLLIEREDQTCQREVAEGCSGWSDPRSCIRYPRIKGFNIFIYYY
jgi:hypothetical protein